MADKAQLEQMVQTLTAGADGTVAAAAEDGGEEGGGRNGEDGEEGAAERTRTATPDVGGGASTAELEAKLKALGTSLNAVVSEKARLESSASLDPARRAALLTDLAPAAAGFQADKKAVALEHRDALLRIEAEAEQRVALAEQRAANCEVHARCTPAPQAPG